jgi:hypothetical protein
MENKSNLPLKQVDKEINSNIPGYPVYPADEDIFNKSIEEGDLDPENPSKSKEFDKNNKSGKNKEIDFDKDESGSDLDVPGSELDDENEKIGSEDEENNYYSLGGDDHDDLDEDKGD